MKVYLVYAKMENQERVVDQVFTEKEQAEAYINFWDRGKTTYWISEKEINQDNWIKINE